MSYLVLARKWRPTRFDDVVGQEHITQTLQNAIRRDRVPHALLFIGSRGVGKTSCARIFAKALNCLSDAQPVATPCEQCNSCLGVNQGNAVDVFEIDGASNNGVEQVRELRESTRFNPSISRFKIYIIDEVHMLSVGAFNALLKTLEEPPPHVKFIFATTEPHKIPDTIISRCQRFDFKRINSKAIVGALERICAAEGIIAEKAALEHVAREAQGGMRDSLSLLDQLISFCGESITEGKTRDIFGLSSREMMLSLLSAVLRQDAAGVITLLSSHAGEGADLKRLSADLLALLRDLMVIKVHPEPEKILSLPSSELDLAKQAAEEFQVGAIHQVFQTLIQRADEIQRSAHPKLLLEMCLMQMCHQVDVATVSEVMTGLLSLEQHLNQVGLDAGLPPLAPPPNFRPPSVHLSQTSPMTTLDSEHSDTSHSAFAQKNAQPNPQEVESNSGFNQAQPTATRVAPESELNQSDESRLTVYEVPLESPQHTLEHSDEQRVQPSQLNGQVHTQGTRSPVEQSLYYPPESHEPVNELDHASKSQNDMEQGLEDNIPDFKIELTSGRPRHPALPADPEQTPKQGEGLNDQVYECLVKFNQWLSQQDSFVGAEMRIKLRYIKFEINESNQGLQLTWGGPQELIEMFESQRVVVIEHLTNLFEPLLGFKPSSQNLRLDLLSLDEQDSRYAFESLTEYGKRKRARLAIQQIDHAVEAGFVQDHLSTFGGQVVYVVPQVLNQESR
ncbi:MAG: hypothetical protein CMH49_07910 [Myxococcales bacterium]|nr:hypothetical protein [Myxococcales bacterium]